MCELLLYIIIIVVPPTKNLCTPFGYIYLAFTLHCLITRISLHQQTLKRFPRNRIFLSVILLLRSILSWKTETFT